ncbi:unnamed protein product [Nyctereutes procyonoides]|uniref:Serine-threonine kinase receptor-associated protein n=1 Tax=Nyctereutes procyonoides TaxID=34880 RepID=A0A811ZN43_NYCPR|nr:unnamed protein product [Nyctereutes procyonoides]
MHPSRTRVLGGRGWTSLIRENGSWVKGICTQLYRTSAQVTGTYTRDLSVKPNENQTFRTERPVNSAALSPNYDYVVLGGGQEAMNVTTASTRIGKFETRFFHLAFKEGLGRVQGHFRPINSVAFHPDGKSYSSGAEDGYVRLYYFDPQYFEFEFEA